MSEAALVVGGGAGASRVLIRGSPASPPRCSPAHKAKGTGVRERDACSSCLWRFLAWSSHSRKRTAESQDQNAAAEGCEWNAGVRLLLRARVGKVRNERACHFCLREEKASGVSIPRNFPVCVCVCDTGGIMLLGSSPGFVPCWLCALDELSHVTSLGLRLRSHKQGEF